MDIIDIHEIPSVVYTKKRLFVPRWKITKHNLFFNASFSRLTVYTKTEYGGYYRIRLSSSTHINDVLAAHKQGISLEDIETMDRLDIL